MEIFYKKLDIHIQNLEEKYRAKYVIKHEMYEDIILVLRDGWGDPQFKYWVQKHFTLVKNGDLYIVYNKGKVSCPVVTYEELYTKLYECHNRVSHPGRDKTWKEVKAKYSWIPYDAVMLFIKLCDSCSSRQNFAKSSATKQILSIDYLSRIQISLIDMTSRPSGNFKWILHTKDSFSKFVWAYPLESKEKMRKTWVDLVILNGKIPPVEARALIEHDNRTLVIALEKWMQHNHTDNWSKGLGPVVYAINTSLVKITNKTPFEVIFREGLRSDFEIWKAISQSVHHCDISNTGAGDDSNDLQNSNTQLNILDENNQELRLALQPQAPTLSPVSNNVIIAHNTLTKTHQTININTSSNYLGLNDKATTQSFSKNFSILNNDTSVHDHRHGTIREQTEEDYFKSTAKRQKLHENAMTQRAQ
ncbi:unnamed protein product [Rotaria magnacalcarata]|uniref:Integrase zinc-binding domain-containing protein n=1 Tax=Rotaria magnacalcarata TaxID=392030 RepID=A0A814XSK8_9BILA|nr:unnamed protein product [Rotaria magnacalcarata]CAF3960972.1 unnamed protein product [Rotaria magnacalcarata]CAF3966347.1 unnamed protein product [Rotaria magnacalcarata]CAF3996334.1 unnamed protein product [Rotaria magnacalcarata]